MGSDGSHFNVSLIVRDKVTRQCPYTTTYFEQKGEPARNRADALQPTDGKVHNYNPSSTTPTVYEGKFNRNKQNLIKTKCWRLNMETERDTHRERKRERADRDRRKTIRKNVQKKNQQKEERRRKAIQLAGLNGWEHWPPLPDQTRL